MYQELKNTLIETGNPFVWVTVNGWYFNEQPDSIKFTSEQALSVNSLDELIDLKSETILEQGETIIKKPSKRTK
jgi:hypothetical protein